MELSYAEAAKIVQKYEVVTSVVFCVGVIERSICDISPAPRAIGYKIDLTSLIVLDAGKFDIQAELRCYAAGSSR